MTKLTLAREKLIEMYIDSLREEQLPWRHRWTNGININGITKNEYKGVNQLLLSLVASNRQYNDSRWFTYVQIQDKGYKLKDAKGKGVPIEFWSVYDKKSKKRIDFSEYERIIELYPEEKSSYTIFCNNAYVYNGDHIDGLPKSKVNIKMASIKAPIFIRNLIKTLNVRYTEKGNQAFYRPSTDEIVLPKKEKFIDKYSYYATQLHELCHSTGHEKRLNRYIKSNNIKDYAREELIAEISASFLMQKLNINARAEHYDNHKAYIQSWINILEEKPNELFKAINESNKVFEYMEKNSNTKSKEKETKVYSIRKDEDYEK